MKWYSTYMVRHTATPKSTPRHMGPSDWVLLTADVPPASNHLYGPITAGDLRPGDVIQQPRARVLTGRTIKGGRAVTVEVRPATIEVVATGPDSFPGALQGTPLGHRLLWRDGETGEKIECGEKHPVDPRVSVSLFGRFVRRGAV